MIMETSTKTDVDIIQELLAIYANRKEVCEKMSGLTSDTNFKNKLSQVYEQSDQFISTLMDELSLHGDAVLSDVNRSNSYLNNWKKILPELDNMDNSALQQNFTILEQSLLEYYQDITACIWGSRDRWMNCLQSSKKN